ncbi:MAG: hypothetical protein OSB21_13775, partial [Myxococcota bacterium]|nr:hypothetical protein [Myxococcota bacterium]
GFVRPRQSSSCEAVMHMGDACDNSSQCDHIPGGWVAGHCGEEGDAAGHCTKACRLNANYNPAECPQGWACLAVPAWNNRWVGQCEPQ